MGNYSNGLTQSKNWCHLAAVPHPAHPHGWGSDRHGWHTWSHCSSLLPASFHYHCWCGKCRLHRHADFGWRWWSPTLTKGRAGSQGHCAVCALPRLQNGQYVSPSVNFFACWLSFPACSCARHATKIIQSLIKSVLSCNIYSPWYLNEVRGRLFWFCQWYSWAPLTKVEYRLKNVVARSLKYNLASQYQCYVF